VARERRGFTLIETLIALLVSSLVVLLAHQLFAGIAERGQTLISARATLDRDANARRWLRAAFLSLEVGTDSAGGFDGRRDHAAFAAWLLTAGGWCERRTIILARVADRFVASSPSGDALVLREQVTGVEFDYLLEPGADARWVREWVSPVGAPLAVRLRLTGPRWGSGDRGGAPVDTLFFLVKERG